MSSQLAVDQHVKYIQALNEKQDELEYHLTEHLRMNGIYWGLTSLALMKRMNALPREAMIDWVMSCWDEDIGGFSPHPGHDVNLHPTLSAIQILATQQALDRVNTDKLVAYIKTLQDPTTGAFMGDEWGETGTRFSYCAVAALALLGRLDALDRDLTVSWIAKCKNFDGGFGMVEGAESHAAYVWTCVGTLSILDRLDVVDQELLAWWLSERQRPNGGLNGRPEKLEDVCYSWWALASLAILGKQDWIDRPKLVSFILSCQDIEQGGIADRPEDQADVWHTVFGLAGLSLSGFPGLEEVDPVYCMPKSVTRRLQLPGTVVSS